MHLLVRGLKVQKSLSARAKYLLLVSTIRSSGVNYCMTLVYAIG